MQTMRQMLQEGDIVMNLFIMIFNFTAQGNDFLRIRRQFYPKIDAGQGDSLAFARYDIIKNTKSL